MQCPRGVIEEKILAKVRPNTKERILAKHIADTITTMLKEALDNNVVITVEGSYAKDTWLRGDLDIDIFVLYPRNKCLKAINSGEALTRLREALKGFQAEERYAQHPYLRILIENVWVDVVPGCLIKPGEKPLTAVDRTPLHRQYITSKLSLDQRDEVRLLKKFFKGIGVYGAEIAVRGFSGYLAELLVAYYGCFRKVLAEAARWKPPVVIDIEGHWQGREQQLLAKFSQQPLIVVDPVDPERNAAAAVSLKSMALFSVAARAYLAQPSIEFFEPTTYHKPLFLDQRNAVVVSMKPPQREVTDKLWGIGQRTAFTIKRVLSTKGYTIVDTSVRVDEKENVIWILVELLEKELPPLEIVKGPPFWLKDHVERFLAKHLSEDAEVWIGDDGRVYALRQRSYHTPLDILRRNIQWVPGTARDYKIEVHMVETHINENIVDLLVKTPEWLWRMKKSLGTQSRKATTK